MRILVTGAAGFIGSHVTGRFLEDRHDVTGFDNFDPFYDRAIKERNLSGVADHPRFRMIEGDLRDASDITSAFEADARIDAVVHLAAKAGVRPSLDDPAGYLTSNLDGTLNLLEAMLVGGCDRLVFASSSSVYGDSDDVPFREDQRVDRPISPYAMTKLAGEQLCHVYAAVHGVHTLCLRLFTVYGPRQRPEMAIHKFTRRIVEGRPIPVYGDGSMERDFTYIDDVVAGIVAAVDRVADHRFEIVNLGNDRPVALSTLIDTLGAAIGREPDIDRQPVPAGDVTRTWASVERARELLGYEPGTPLGDGVARFVEWYRDVAAPAGVDPG